MIRRRNCSNIIHSNKYKREFIGDIIITDDPNDDWLGITFNIWLGDFVPGCLYINKVTKKTKTNYQIRISEEDAHKTAFTTPFGLYEYNSSFSCWLVGFIINKNIVKYNFDKTHKSLLKKLLFSILNNMTCLAILDTPIPCFQQRV